MRIKYFKFILFFLVVVLSVIFYEDAQRPELHAAVISAGYVGVFIAGMLYTYGFTTPFATALLIIFGGDLNVFIAGIVAGGGALVSDLFIFGFIRKFFSDEIASFSHENTVKKIHKLIPRSLRKPMVFLIAGIFFASPVPDELAVAFLATQRLSAEAFAIFSYVCNTIGIVIILFIGSAL